MRCHSDSHPFLIACTHFPNKSLRDVMASMQTHATEESAGFDHMHALMLFVAVGEEVNCYSKLTVTVCV